MAKRAAKAGKVPGAKATDAAFDVESAPQPSAYARVLAEVTPRLGTQDLAALTPARAGELAKSAGVAVDQVRALAAAQAAAPALALPAEVLFALGKNGQVPGAEDLARLAPEGIKTRLEGAVTDGKIPAAVVEAFDSYKPSLERLRIERAPLETIAGQIGLVIPPELAKMLADQKMTTLADIRKAGGLGDLSDLPGPEQTRTAALTAARALQAQADLSSVSTDLRANVTLIKSGYTSPAVIARTPADRFLSQVAPEVPQAAAGQVYALAALQNRLLNHEISNEVILRPPHPRPCQCEDCRSAVSPDSYLTDLMDYALTHLQFYWPSFPDPQQVTLQHLIDLFYQPFDQMPLSCEASDEAVSQVRLCIETLRRYLADQSDLLADTPATRYPVKFAFAADVDGDGRDEIVIAPDWSATAVELPERQESNALWVMDYDPAGKQWRHISPVPGHPYEADLTCGPYPYAAQYGFAADVDGDHRLELVLAIGRDGETHNEFWIMQFDPAAKQWKHMIQSTDPSKADLDPSSVAVGARSALGADVDDDGRAELVMALDRPGKEARLFWVMDYDPAAGQWRHLSPIQNHPLNADLDPYPDDPNAVIQAGFVVPGDYNGDGCVELAINLVNPSSAPTSRFFWVLHYDVNQTPGQWVHLRYDQGDVFGSAYGLPIPAPARFGIGTDVDGDGRDELVIGIQDTLNADVNALWVAGYDYAGVPVNNWMWQDAGIIDCTSKPTHAQAAIAINSEGVAPREIAVLPVFENSSPDRSTPHNGLWIMQLAAGQWQHESPIASHPLDADLDWSKSTYPADAIFRADVDGDGHDEIVVLPAYRKAIWVMQYNPGAKVWQHFTPQVDLAQAERDTLWAAYRMLLTRLGTSYEEIRLARSAAAADRQALADRLGIMLGSATRPDNLDALLLDQTTLSEASLESLFGLRDTHRQPFTPAPYSALQQWRAASLRATWLAEDGLDDEYSRGALPAIDPDIVTVDDLRGYDPTVAASPSALWLKRRQWVDARLAALRAKTRQATVNGQTLTLPDLDAMVTSLRQDAVTYDTVQITVLGSLSANGDLDTRREELTGGDAAQTEAAAKFIREKLFLTPDSFMRLMEIKDNAQAFATGSSPDPVTDGEWEEAYSILAQVVKTAFYSTWVQEETAWQTPTGQPTRVLFSPRYFWPSLRAPQEGLWSAVIPKPYIDPERVGVRDLPDSAVGNSPRQVWDQRRNALKGLTQTLRAAYRTGGLAGLLDAAFGTLPSGMTWEEKITQVKGDLDSGDATRSGPAQQVIRTQLYLMPDGFTQLFNLVATLAAILQPSILAWNENYKALTTALKLRTLYPTWIQEETTKSWTYWDALKARLPRWRCDPEARQAWLQALDARKQAPLIDPDTITPGHIQPGAAAAQQIYQQRQADLTARHDMLKNQTRDLAGFLANLQLADSAGLDEPVLAALITQRANGEDVAARLGQIGFTPGAFDMLARIYRLLKDSAPVLPDEWAAVDDILTQVWKQRQFADWRAQESAGGLALSPDVFQVPARDPAVFPPAADPALNPWRATRRAQRDWLDMLQARIDQDAAIGEALRSIVSSVEEATLPLLRDALVKASPAPGSTLMEKAKWLEGRLLVDTQAAGCQVTTRTAQAIETLQALLWSARTGELDGPDLFLYAPNFDDEWRWIGSYATWRAAMFVYLYPENLLLPSLKPDHSPAFRDLVSALRGGRTLSALVARQTVEPYTAYFKNVCTLDLQATAIADRRVEDRTGTARMERRLFLFAISSQSDKAYWCSRDGNTKDAETQTFWEEIPELAPALRVFGAAEYRPGPRERYLYLFARVRDGRTSKLVFCRCDLERGGGFDSPTDLKLPGGAADFTAADLLQSPNAYTPLRLHITLTDGKDYLRSLNGQGKDWEDADFQPVNYTITYAQWKDAALNAGVICNKDFKAQKVIDWIKAANNYAGSQPGFVGGFPNFQQSGSNYGVIMLTADAVDTTVTQFPITNQVDLSTITGVVQRFIDAHLFSQQFRNASGASIYASAFPTFNDTGTNYGVIAIKREAAVGWPFGIILPPDECTFAVYFNVIDTGKGNYAGGFPDFVAPMDTIYLKKGDDRQRPVGTAVPLETVGWYKPLCSGPFSTALFRADADPAGATAYLTQLYEQTNAGAPRSILAYLDEAFYDVPVMAALQLQKAGEYITALDYFRTVYDYPAPIGKRKVFYGLHREETLAPGLASRAAGWLLDPLNPHAVAATRRSSYTRYTLQALIRCLLDYADAEFTRDTSESLPRARILYEQALDLLGLPDLQPGDAQCQALIGWIERTFDFWHLVPVILFPLVNQLMSDLRTVNSAPVLQAFLEEARSVREQNMSWEQALPHLQAFLARLMAQTASQPAPVLAKVLEDRPLALAQAQRDWLAREGGQLLPAGQPALDAGGGALAIVLPPAVGSGGNIPLPFPRWEWVPTITFDFCVAPNPLPSALRMHAELNLYKIRTCRNIAGMQREIEPYAAPTDTSSGLPTIGAGGQLVLPGTVVLRPTPYRYSVLSERAKQLAGLAQQVETAFLNALEKRDAEAYTLLKARQDVLLARAGVRLQDLKVNEAEAGVRLAQLQKQRAEIQFDTYQEFLDEGLLPVEHQLIDWYYTLMGAQIAGATAQGFLSAMSMPADLAFGGEYAWNIAVIAKGLADSLAAVAQSQISVLGLYDSLERRKQDWVLNQKVANQDIVIGDQQITIAEDSVRVAGQERLIAQMTVDNDQTAVDFLINKFTNADLYDWMSGVLEGVYRFFLQQATVMAQLASSQLAFERHETPPPFIQSDYWQAPSQDGASSAAADGSTTGSGPDRRGMTGSARLLQDIYQLDQFAFDNNKRKLQLSKTISLAQLSPVEFQRFRETGLMRFATPAGLFDRDFAGHYLRLVHKVRVSVVALVPPTQGIRASLTAAGLSRVVIGGDIFQTELVRRDPQMVALSSPANASGLFDLDPQSDLLAPFEGLGVDTSWELAMPKAANPFDYQTIADVLLTIEYTALNSFDYRQQVLQQLDTNISADRAFSFRSQFADAWYDLHNPEQLEEAQQMVARFTTTPADFPPNLDQSSMKIQNLVLYFARKDGSTFEIPVSALRFIQQNSRGAVGGAASTVDGTISTRGGNAASWKAITNKPPFGDWTLVLPNTEEMRGRFMNEEIEDILFVISYTARAPEWPG